MIDLMISNRSKYMYLRKSKNFLASGIREVIKWKKLNHSKYSAWLPSGIIDFNVYAPMESVVFETFYPPKKNQKLLFQTNILLEFNFT